MILDNPDSGDIVTYPEISENSPPLREGVHIASGYEIMEHLSRSNDYDVYHVWSEERYCSCIAKTPRPDRLKSDSVHSRLIKEGELLKRLAHPNLVRAYEVFADPAPVVILETLTGQTLAYVIETYSKRRIPYREISYLGVQLCSAIQYLHREDLLHLDLKPSNIVSQPPLAKVMDLSIARPPGKGRRGVGTRQYMAPEQARGDLLGPATDTWGIGAVLFEAATGEAPFEAYEGKDGYQQLECRARPVRTHRRLPASLANAIDDCLEPEPAQRPTISRLAKALNEITRA